MDNASSWLLYESDDSDNPDDFYVEDLLEHYREKNVMRV